MDCQNKKIRYIPDDGGKPRGTPPTRGTFRTIITECGKCIFCRMAAAREMKLRLQHQELECRSKKQSVWFLTLTYNEENLPQDNLLNKRDPQLFFKRLREEQRRKKENLFKPFYVGEYGDKGGRPHYHAILFGLELSDYKKHGARHNPSTGKQYPWGKSQTISRLWGMGTTEIAPVMDTSVLTYCTKYILKQSKGYIPNPNDPEGDMIQSRFLPGNPFNNSPHGLGRWAFEKYYKEWFTRGHCMLLNSNGDRRPVAIPRIYKTWCKTHDPEMFDTYSKMMETTMTGSIQEHVDMSGKYGQGDRKRQAQAAHAAELKITKHGTSAGKL